MIPIPLYEKPEKIGAGEGMRTCMMDHNHGADPRQRIQHDQAPHRIHGSSSGIADYRPFCRVFSLVFVTHGNREALPPGPNLKYWAGTTRGSLQERTTMDPPGAVAARWRMAESGGGAV